RVDILRTDDRGNALPTFMGPLVDRGSQNIRATAIAKVAAGNATECLKPIGLPAPLPTADGDLLDIDDITLDEVGTLIHMRDTNTGSSGRGGGRGGGGDGPHPYGPG